MDHGGIEPELPDIAARHPGLGLLILHGSRARGDAHAGSDWDVGYLASGGLDWLALRADLVHAVGTDELDVVDLSSASALLRFEAGRHGRCLFERSEGGHLAFVLEVTQFWCDAEAVIRRAGEAVLAGLSP